MGFNNSELLTILKQMLIIRKFEQSTERQYKRGKIAGFLHIYSGQEAIAVGTIGALKENDYIVTHYRDHGHAIARGINPDLIMAELYGKIDGTNGGRGGSMHIMDSSKNFMGGYAIVAGQLPIAIGLAMASKFKKKNDVIMCFFGDGAVNEGEFHECLNLASLWKLPVLFILENNLYGMGSSIYETHACGKDVYLSIEDPYKIPAAQVDGMDFFAVRELTEEAIHKIRSGNGPFFIEAMTYRFRGHSIADPSKYRDNSEVEMWIDKDPITFLKDYLVQKNLKEEILEIEKEADEIVLNAESFAENSALPTLDSRFKYVVND
ncbi:MAG: pyruvate dehydrogenase (acetyl-transferring) E1 component subunit alpha [Chloroflexi bacterium]|nr:pyruvate dehydrogenase (acetyl-transferring) E1 component subunit alpha [Chloroflexota bacterium]|tara:strand:- start:323 stop:1285 length:963 start_codon:yes stop_codon:yes gene_type:complete